MLGAGFCDGCLMKYCFALALCAVAAVALSQEKLQPPAVGETAPAIELKSLLQAPAGATASWEALKGKVVVLEFWATWCGPCVGAISHMNELTDAFKDRPVQFIAITDEDAATIKEFLDKKPIHGWVGLNTSGSMLKAYGVEGIPHTVVVDKSGKIAGVTHPLALNAQHLENVLAGKESGLDADADNQATVPATKATASEPPAFFQYIIRPSSSKERGGSGGAADTSELGLMYESTSTGLALKDLLPGAYGVHSSCVFVEGPLYEGKLDLLIRAPRENMKQFANLGRQTLETTFGLTSRREVRDVDVYVLTVKTPHAKGFRSTVFPKTFFTSFGPGNVEAVNVSIDALIDNWLNYVLKKPVIDETNLSGKYDVELKWESDGKIPNDSTKLIEAVREQLGLELTLTKRPREVAIISKKQP